jgi:hypothetical protein
MKLPDDKKSISNSDMVNFVSQTADLINGTDTEFEISDGENQRTFVDNFKLDSPDVFFDRLVTKTIELVIGASSLGSRGTIIPCSRSSSR